MADIGTGSGILAICASKLAAKNVYGCENDELVIETAIQNAKMNDVDSVFEHKTADLLSEKFDFITANILHNVLAEIMGDLKNLMLDDAKLVLSGIMDEKKQVVLDALKQHKLVLIEELKQDIWVGLVVKKQ
jgi:ribosomal protein L11 methyltransferase